MVEVSTWLGKHVCVKGVQCYAAFSPKIIFEVEQKNNDFFLGGVEKMGNVHEACMKYMAWGAEHFFKSLLGPSQQMDVLRFSRVSE